MWQVYSSQGCEPLSQRCLSVRQGAETTSVTDSIRSAPLTNPVPVLCHLDATPAKLMSHQSRPCVNSSQYICQPSALHMPASCSIGGNPQTTICQRRTSAWPDMLIQPPRGVGGGTTLYGSGKGQKSPVN